MPELVVIEGPLKDQVFDLGDKDTVFCGRHPRMNDISILDITVSRKHFKIFKIGNNLFIEDLNSKHGTIINDRQIRTGEGFQVEEGDLIKIGTTVMRLTDVSGKGSLIRTDSVQQQIKSGSEPGEETKKERRSAKEIELIYSVSELFKKQMDIGSFLDKVLELLMEALPRIDNARIFLCESEKQIDEVTSKAHGKDEGNYSKKVLKKVIRERKTVRMSNTDFESPDSYVDSKDTLEIRSILCVPIVRDNRVLGALYIDSLKPYGFRKEDQRMLNGLAGPMAVAIEQNISSQNTVSAHNIFWKGKFTSLFKKIHLNQ